MATHDHRDVDDAGFSLVEVLVAGLVLAMGAAAVASVLVAALGLSRGNSQRVQASALMTAELESARGQAVDVLPEGTTSAEVVQQGTRYTVRRDVAWLTSGAGADACTASAARTVTKTVAVTVTWPAMGTTAPVRGDTQLAASPTSPVLAGLPGAVAVTVGAADGTAVAGAQVRLVGPSPATTAVTATTGTTGCASFPSVAAGAYEAQAVLTGNVSTTQSATATTGSFSVLPGRVARSRTVLDRSGTIVVTTTAATGTSQVVGVPLTLEAPFVTPSPRRSYVSCSLSSGTAGCLVEDGTGTRRNASPLFPGSYRVAGCAASSTGVPVTLPRGGSAGVSLALATAALRGASGNSNPPSTVYARPAAGSACAGAPTMSLSTTSSRDIALPDGPWQFSRTSSFLTSTTVTLATSGSPAVQVPL